MHYGSKQYDIETSNVHFPTSLGVSEVSRVSEVSEVSERVSAAEGASEASSPEQANE